MFYNFPRKVFGLNRGTGTDIRMVVIGGHMVSGRGAKGGWCNNLGVGSVWDIGG